MEIKKRVDCKAEKNDRLSSNNEITVFVVAF